jgi:phosphatidate cytidylyltransferase
VASVKLTSLQSRILSTLVLAPLTLGLIYAGGLPYIIFILFGAGLILREWVRMAQLGNTVKRDILLGVAYTAIAAAAFIDLRLRHHDSGLGLVITLMLCVWGSDIGAYLFGKTIGGPKLMPSVSPNKTWAGFVGAMLFPAVIMAIAVHVGGYDMKTSLIGFGAGAVFGVVGQAGDLLISKFKRRVGVKDTGTPIPGHGGILDRVDSLMLVAPVFLLAYVLWR